MGGIMSDPGKYAAALGAALLVIALGGCAGAAGTAESFELHQERARPASGAQATEMQGKRLAGYADASAAAGDVAADAQGDRLAEYAEASAAAGSVSAHSQGQRLAEYAAALEAVAG
jgi:hypothetical protein